MDDKTLQDLLEDIKVKKGFPPSERASAIKSDFSSRGLGLSGGCVGQIVNAYLDIIRDVLEEFTENILRNANKLNLASDVQVNQEIYNARDRIFLDAQSLLAREFGQSEDYKSQAVSLLSEKRGETLDRLQRKVRLRELDLGISIQPPQIPSNNITQKDFSFIKEPQLRDILERDYSVIQRAFNGKCWKSVIILSGGAIEAILTDLLLQNQTKAMAASKAPKKPDITKWDLADLINVCVELNLVSSGIDKLSHPVREYRNLVHPGNEIRNKSKFDEEEAKIALEVLHILHRDLS